MSRFFRPFPERTRVARAVAASGGGGEEMGTIGDYAGLSLATYDIYTVDLFEQDYPTFTTNGGSVSYNAAYGIDGRPGVRCFPPTTSEGYGALGGWQLFNAGGSNNFTNFYLRWCMQIRADYAVNNDFDAVKYCIIHSENAGTGGADPIRPIMYVDSRISGIGPTGGMFMCPAQGTNRYFSESHPTSTFFDGDGRGDFYFGQSATTYAGKRVIAPTDWVCVEVYCESASTGSWPNGLIRQRITARDGTVLSDLDSTMGWQHDPSAPFTKYFYEVQVLGGYYNGATGTAGADNCTAIDRYVTFAKNQTDFLGPPTGFLT